MKEERIPFDLKYRAGIEGAISAEDIPLFTPPQGVPLSRAREVAQEAQWGGRIAVW